MTQPSADQKYEMEAIPFTTSLTPLNTNAQNLCLEWKNWSRNFKIFMRASALDQKPEPRKVALLLHHIGCSALHVVNSFNIDIDSVPYGELWNKLENYFVFY